MITFAAKEEICKSFGKTIKRLFLFRKDVPTNVFHKRIKSDA
jgi:hypothetical protein